MESNAFMKSTVAVHILIPQDDPLFGKFFWSPPDLLLDVGQALGIIFHTLLSRTACTSMAVSKLGGNCLHPRRHLSCRSLLFSLSSILQVWSCSFLWPRWRSVSSFLSSRRCNLWCLQLVFHFRLEPCQLWVCWLHFVVLQTWFQVFFCHHSFLAQSCFFHCLRTVSCRTLQRYRRFLCEKWCIHLFCSWFSWWGLSSLLFWFSEYFGLIWILQVFFQCHDVFSPFFFLWYSFFFFFFLNSFNRCFSSLGNFLLSSMSLMISASLSTRSSFFVAASYVVSCFSLSLLLVALESRLNCNTIEPASSTWGNFCAARCSSWPLSGCSSPSGRCFGSRSPARTSQLLLQPVGLILSCAPSPPVLTSVWELASSSSFPQGVDVHPSGRLCSRWAEPPRGMSASLLLIMVPPSVSSKTVSTRALSSIDAAAVSRCSSLLLRFLLPPSDSCATVSTVVLPASDAAAVLLLLSSLLLRFLLLPSVSCATFSTRVLSAPAAAAVFFASFLVSCASFSFLATAFFIVTIISSYLFSSSDFSLLFFWLHLRVQHTQS